MQYQRVAGKAVLAPAFGLILRRLGRHGALPESTTSSSSSGDFPSSSPQASENVHCAAVGM